MSSVSSHLDILLLGVFAKYSPDQLDALHASLSPLLLEDHPLPVLFDLRLLHFYVLLLSHRDNDARAGLDRIHDQFGAAKSQQILLLRLMLAEATGDRKAAIAALGTNPDELRASRRLATLARRRSDGTDTIPDYVRALNHYLALQPADTLAWAELGHQYHKVGHYDKAVFCFQEVLMARPHAYNVLCDVGTAHYYYVLQQQQAKRARKKDELLAHMARLRSARDAFLRAAELSATYTRAWVGVQTTTGCAEELLGLVKGNKTVDAFVDECRALRDLSATRIGALAPEVST